MSEKRRAQSLKELATKSLDVFSKEVLEQGLALKLRPTDVVITPYGKSGTTWTQQIVHALRTRGDMDFDDISRVIPWIEVSAGLDLDLNAEQKASPRAFKSHLSWDQIPRGGRYINVVRDPGDAAVSLLRFQEGWFLEPGAVPTDEFVEEAFLSHRRYYKHLQSWWPHRNDDNVLFLAYEKMLKDSTDTICRIAEFIGIELDDELLAITEKHASLAFMLKYKDRFDDAILRKLSEDKGGIPLGSDSAKVREGTAGGRAELSDATLARLDQVWREEITSSLGFETYSDLIADLT